MEHSISENERFSKGVEEAKNQLFTYLMVKSGFNRAVSEKVFIDTIEAAKKSFRGFDETKHSFNSWLLHIAYGLFPASDGNSDEEMSISSEMFELDKESKAISGILLKMNESERELISLRYFQDFGYDEISVVTGKKEGAIRTAVSRALSRYSQLSKKSA